MKFEYLEDGVLVVEAEITDKASISDFASEVVAHVLSTSQPKTHSFNAVNGTVVTGSFDKLSSLLTATVVKNDPVIRALSLTQADIRQIYIINFKVKHEI